jgi:ornithine cyclodeaminase
VRAFDINKQTAEQFAADMSKEHGIQASAVDSPEDAVRGADIIVTVTIADEPIVKEAWMQPGSFFAAVGSYQEEEYEVVLNSDLIVVDAFEHVLHRETPVIALMVKDQRIKREQVIEMGQLVGGELSGRTSDDQRVFFSPIGLAIDDICLCHKVYKLAQEKGVGTQLNLFGG